MTREIPRSWQLLMVGPGIDRITPDLRDKLVRLFDLLPATNSITIETDAGYVTASRDWPSDRMEEAAAIVDAIATAPGVSGVSLPKGA